MPSPGVLPDGFTVEPVTRISPSRFVRLKSCRLREVWASNRLPSLLPTNPRAHLGTIVHAMLAAAGRGEISSEVEVESLWADLVNGTEKEMLGSWLERSLVPLSKSVRNYDVDVLRAISKVREIVLRRQDRGSAELGRAAGSGFELRVHTPDEKVCGYVDHAYRDEDGIVIRDYKSGYIVESTDDGTPMVKEDFIVQLRIYAALYRLTFDQWPARLELTPIQGEPVLVPFDPAECMNLLDEARALLDEINTIVRHTQEEHLSPANLASPSAETCRPCGYRPTCSAYRDLNKSAADAGWPADVWGTVEKIQPLMNGQLAVVLQTHDKVEVIRGISPNGRHPALTSVVPGQRVAIFNLQKSFPIGGWQEGPYTTIYQCHG